MVGDTLSGIEPSALTEELDLAHASHAISTEVATALFTPCLKGFLYVLVGLNGDIVIFIQVLELHDIVFTRCHSSATVDRPKGEICRALELRVDTILESLIGNIQGDHKSEDLGSGWCVNLDLELSWWRDVGRQRCS